MSSSGAAKGHPVTLTFATLIKKYSALQKSVVFAGEKRRKPTICSNTR